MSRQEIYEEYVKMGLPDEMPESEFEYALYNKEHFVEVSFYNTKEKWISDSFAQDSAYIKGDVNIILNSDGSIDIKEWK